MLLLWGVHVCGFIYTWRVCVCLHFKMGLGGAVLFSLFIIVDVQMMLKKVSTDEYILCAINLYLDILNLFLEILRVLNSRN